MAGISATNFNFADTDSSIAVNLAGDTSASATSILGNAISNLTSSVMGFFGSGTQNQITGVQSVDAIVSDHGFSQAASVGGSATSTATQSAEALSGYTITTSDELVIQGKTTIDSSSSASVVDA